MSQESALEIDYVNIFVMDFFEKNQLEYLIKKLNQEFGESKGKNHVTITNFPQDKRKKEVSYAWQVNDIEKLLLKVKEIEKDLAGDVSLAKDIIKKITISLKTDENQPFFPLLISIKIDKSKLNVKSIFDEIETILRPLRLYMEEFRGITRQLFGPKPICPYFFHIGLVLSSKVDFQVILDASENLLKFERIPQKFTTSIDKIIGESASIRELIPLKNMKWEANLLSIAALYANSVMFVGHLEQMNLNGLMTPFALSFSSEKGSFPVDWDTEIFLTIRPYSYDTLFSPWSTTGTIIYLLGLYCWSMQLEKLISEVGSNLEELYKKIKKLNISDDESELEKYVIELDLNRLKIAEFTSEVGRLSREISTSLKDFLKGRKTNYVEIPIPPATKTGYTYTWNEHIESLGSGAYLQAMALKISSNLKKLEEVLIQNKHENELHHGSVNSIVKLRDQKSNRENQSSLKKIGKYSLGISGLTLVATVILLVVTVSLLVLTGQLIENAQSTEELLDKIFIVENFDPFLNAQGSEIYLQNTRNQTKWSYTDIITIYAATNNFLRFTITDVTLVNHGGECYFESEPIVSLLWPQSEILGKNSDSVELKQIVSIEFSPREEVVFDLSNIKETDYNKGFKSLVYDIEVENMQTGDITTFRTDNSYLWVYLPSEIDC